MNNNANQLIDLIYEAAIEPSKWMDLLSALADLVDRRKTTKYGRASSEYAFCYSRHS
jgi:hypothetical protein